MLKLFFFCFVLFSSLIIILRNTSHAKEALAMTPKFDYMLVERGPEEFEFGYISSSSVADEHRDAFMDYAKYITNGLGFNTKITFKVDDTELHMEVNHRYDHQYLKQYKTYDEL
ncbi:hypothetical protein BCR42DRAFT_154407 [Absidia repens]|uniref:Uncharacterized protein n=1 Tax=Absidia repens TaxID=90262 RepID=A0A1X2I114_9FUNG|nr:hypothetical protein BCR42DRAFT_154407 [Absidia repens]